MELFTVKGSDLNKAVNKRTEDEDRELTIHDIMDCYAEAVGAQTNVLSDHALKKLVFKQLKNFCDFDSTVQEGARIISGVKNSTDCVIAAIEKEDKAAIKSAYKELKAYQARIYELEEAAYKDELTGLHNRKYLFAQKLENNQHFKASGTLFLLNIKAFKEMTTRYGYTIGDSIIKLFSKALGQITREKPFELIRLDGAGFVILVPELYAGEVKKSIAALQSTIGAKRYKITGTEKTLGFEFSFSQYNYTRSDAFDTVITSATKLMR